MPDIGDQLRESRMRNRIDITEVEAATKIRAKYLRALENEEWDLLPGPTFVKTFLRTYAEYLGLDSRNLVEEYRLRYERASGPELTPFGGNLGSRRARPRRPAFAPWTAIAIGILALVGGLWAYGTFGNDPGDDEEPARPTPAPAATAEPRDGGGRDKERRKRRTRVRLQIVPTGPVSVCLENAGGDALIGNLTLDAGQDSRVFRGRRFRVSFGTPAAVMRVDGRRFAVAQDAPVGYEVRAGGRPRRLAEAQRPTCAP
jgi:cytoskeleton protein RodZ